MTPEQASGILAFLVPDLQYEHQTTRRVLQAIPEDRADYKPQETSMSARVLAAHLLSAEVMFLEGILSGKFGMPTVPDLSTAKMTEILETHDRQVPALVDRLTSLTPQQLAGEIDFHGFKLPAIAFVQLTLKHTIHHRGQLSTYLRPMGAKVPSIYGGSADQQPEMPS